MSAITPEVLSSAEARKSLPAIVERLRSGETSSVFFGSHRRAEAVIVSVDAYERMVSLLEDAEIARIVLDRMSEPAGEPMDLGDFAESIGVSRQHAA